MKVRVEVIGANVAEMVATQMEQSERAIQNALAGTAKDVKVDFDVTTQTWRNRPVFVIEQDGQYSRLVGTDNEIYVYVSKGTRPHIIRPRSARMLAFPANYQAKTTPRQIASRSGGASGPTVYSGGVMHPGTEARDFDQVIADKWRRLWPAVLERALLAELG